MGLLNSLSNFKGLRISDKTWKLCRSETTLGNTASQHIPKFNRVHSVVFINGCLQCNCPLTKIWGMLCIHSIFVASTLKPDWEYPSYRDVSVLWWKSYLKSANTNAWHWERQWDNDWANISKTTRWRNSWN